MPDPVIRVENLWKEYHLGTISHRTLTRDLQSWWSRVRGKDDPNAQLQPSRFSAASSPSTSCSQKTENSAKTADRFWALRDVSFEVNQGEVLGIIGANGAGKSTLLKILSRVTTPTRGRVKIKGRIASLLEVGTGFHPELTGRENIFLNGSILGMSRIEIQSKLDEIIDFSGLSKFIDTPVKRYSSGMYVRLAFAVAAHLDPEILIVDEVLAVGDMEFRKKCTEKMEVVAGAGKTVIFVSHQLSLVSTLCTRGIMLEDGRLGLIGSVDDAIGSYLKLWQDPTRTELRDGARNGSGRILVTKIACYSGILETEPAVFQSGDLFRLCFSISKIDEIRDIISLIFAVRIETHTGQSVFSIHNRLTGDQLDLEQQTQVTLTIPKLPLMPGEYWLTYNMFDGSECLDGMDRAISFTVAAGPFYKTGEIPSPRSGLVMVEGNWSLENVTQTSSNT